MKMIVNKIAFWCVLYPLGLILGLLFQLLRLLGRIEVLHWQRFPHWQGNLIVVANHPSLLETVLIPLLFFGQYIRHPTKFIPWNTPDKKNFYDPCFFWWLRCRSIPIERGEGKELANRKVLRQMLRVLREGQILILFPEGGRTFKGEKAGEEFSYSKKGHKIRELKEGVALVALKIRALIIPIWVEGAEKVLPNNCFPFPKFWRAKVVIKIGQPFSFSKEIKREEATKKLTQVLLELADE